MVFVTFLIQLFKLELFFDVTKSGTPFLALSLLELEQLRQMIELVVIEEQLLVVEKQLEVLKQLDSPKIVESSRLCVENQPDEHILYYNSDEEMACIN